MNDIAKNRFSVLVMTIVLLTGAIIPGMMAMGKEEPGETKELNETRDSVVLINTENPDELEDLKEYGEIIDNYGKNTILRTTKADELADDYKLDHLENRNELHVNGHKIDTNDYELEEKNELTIEEYESGTEGIYIIDMIGPVNPEWRNELEKVGVDIINYIPNYAYEVSMTPEEADDVREFNFVDWVGIYQPEYKIDLNIGNALQENSPLDIRLNPYAGADDIEKIALNHDIIGFENLKDQGFRFVIDTDSAEEVETLAENKGVYYISEYIEPELHGEMDIQQIGGGLWFMDDEYEHTGGDQREGNPDIPYRKHGDYGAYMNQIGYTGQEITVAIADTGIGDGTIGDAGVEDFTGRVIGGHSIGDDEDYWAGGHYHGTACTGLVAGDTYDGSGATWDEYDDGENPYYMGQGLASNSEIFAMKIFDDDGNSMIDEYYPIIEEVAQQSDAYIHSNSWGSGTYGTYITADEVFDQAVRDADRDTEGNQPMVITTSAGNDGWMGNGTIGSPATAKNIITVGGNQPYNPGLGYENPENMYDSSSRGWTKDNRVKPDVIAPSESVISQNTPLDDEGDYLSASGTSFGNPLVAGASTIVVDWYEQNMGVRPSPAMVKSILINTANELDPEKGDTSGHIPNKDEGWGVADVSKLEYPLEDPINYMFEDQTSLLTTGEEDEYKLTYDEEGEPMKITTTWTDKNALDGDNENGSPALKNNLDLEVETPSGDIIRGNAFDLSGDGESDDGFTYPDADVMEDFDLDEDGWDDVNNVENVYIPSEDLEPGIYTVRVKGTNIPADANNDGQANQDYALTAQNSILPEDGELAMDSDRYAEEDTVEIDVIDQDMFDQDTVSVDLKSYDLNGDEVDNVSVRLRGERRGVVSGSVDVSPDFEDDDQGLYVEHGYEIEAVYYDQSLEEYKYDYADIDGEPPVAVNNIDVNWSKDSEDNNITWDLSEDDSNETFEGYRIYRAESTDGTPGEWEIIDTVRPGTGEYIDENKGKDDYTRYWYDISAVDDVGNENITENPDVESPSVRIDSPEENFIWSSGDQNEIEWYAASGGQNTQVNIEYSTDSGENWTTIDENIDVDSGIGTYDWLIPEIDGTKNESHIRITIEDNEGSSTTVSKSFVLSEYQPPSVDVISPGETSRWYSNTTEVIQWNTDLGDAGEIVSAELEYSLDAGQTWEEITVENNDDGSYDWNITEETSYSALIKVRLNDDNGLYAENTSQEFEIIASEPPENANVDYVSLEEETLFQDTLEEGVPKTGYDVGEIPNGVNEWNVRDHGSFTGDYSWDFGDNGYENIDGGGLSWLISPEIEIPEDSSESELTFYHWRDFDYRYDGGNLKISTDGNNWELIEPENGYSDTISEEFDNPLSGEPAWTEMNKWNKVRFDLEDYIGETVQFNWSAGVDHWESNKLGWRIDDIEVTAERPYSGVGDNKDNIITWDSSVDDGAGANNIEKYNVYRSENTDDVGEQIAEIEADGFDSYRYFDRSAGTADNKTWIYTIKAENVDGIENLEGVSDKEPTAPYPQEELSPGHESAVQVSQHDYLELGLTAAHSSSNTPMNISFYSAETDELIGEVNDVYKGDEISVEWDKFLPEGEYAWYVVIDDGEYQVQNEEWNFIVDITNPEVDIITPESQEKLNDSTVNVSWSGKDEVTDIAYYELRVRDVLGWTNVEDNTEADIQKVPEGKNIIDIRAVDEAGNHKMDTVEFTVDTSVPELDITNPENGEAFGESHFTLEWYGNDEITEIANYDIRLNEDDWTDVGLSESYTVTELKEGKNMISVRATDIANNEHISSIEVIYDTTNPNMNVTSVEEGQVIENDSLELEWKGEVTWKDEDVLSAVDKYDVRLDNNGWIDYDYEEPAPPDEGGDLLWQHSKHDDYVYSVYESDGVVYSGSWDDTVIAYDYEEEEVLWQHEHHENNVGYVVEANGTVFSGSYDGTVVAADAETGELKWQHSHHSSAVYSVDATDDTVYSGSGDTSVIAADAETGELIWEHDHHSSGSGVFSVHESDGVVYSGSIIDNLVVAADAETGEFIWDHSHHDGMIYSVYESDGVVYSGGDGGWGSPGQVFAADADDGELIWMHEHHDDTPSQVYSVHEANGIVYSASEDNTVLAVDADDGSKIWQHEHHDHFVHQVFESDGVIYSASGDGSVAAAIAEDEEPAPTPELSHTFDKLEDGEHTVYIRATNKAGNQYIETVNFTVNTHELTLDINHPKDGVKELTYDEDFTIQGETDPNATVYIDRGEVTVDANGTFTHNTTLIEGQNIFEVKAENQEGDIVTENVYALYLPQIPEMQDDIENL
ncbi:MAG: PQQ-binding-like beta-propeller repeat protein, partial [Candidatus Saliniplasma sp.]